MKKLLFLAIVFAVLAGVFFHMQEKCLDFGYDALLVGADDLYCVKETSSGAWIMPYDMKPKLPKPAEGGLNT